MGIKVEGIPVRCVRCGQCKALSKDTDRLGTAKPICLGTAKQGM